MIYPSKIYSAALLTLMAVQTPINFVATAYAQNASEKDAQSTVSISDALKVYAITLQADVKEFNALITELNMAKAELGHHGNIRFYSGIGASGGILGLVLNRSMKDDRPSKAMVVLVSSVAIIVSVMNYASSEYFIAVAANQKASLLIRLDQRRQQLLAQLDSYEIIRSRLGVGDKAEFASIERLSSTTRDLLASNLQESSR